MPPFGLQAAIILALIGGSILAGMVAAPDMAVQAGRQMQRR